MSLSSRCSNNALLRPALTKTQGRGVSMHYYAYEMAHAVLSPWRFGMQALRHSLDSPFNPMSRTTMGRNMAAACEVFENLTRRYGKPEFLIKNTQINGLAVPIRQETALAKPFCNLLHFARDEAVAGTRHDPKVLIVAPMSGHYATLLRGTVEAFLPNHDVYITDWVDARMVPLASGGFDLDDYIDYLVEMLHFLGGDTHIVAVCQPSVPVLAATALMEADNDPYAPRTITLMGGPIDTRSNPTAVNKLAQERGVDWFRRNVITKVPFPHPGVMRDVYPGFLQLNGFVSMNFDRHMDAHRDLFFHLVRGDGDSVTKHREFYDEYLAVMDLTAEYYLQTVDTVFVRHALPKGEMTHRGRRVDPSKIRNTGLLTVEGEHDDISGVGQTEAAHKLCFNIPPDRRAHYLQLGVGHYGVFNGSRFRSEVAPRISDFILSVQTPSKASAKPAVRQPLKVVG